MEIRIPIEYLKMYQPARVSMCGPESRPGPAQHSDRAPRPSRWTSVGSARRPTWWILVWCLWLISAPLFAQEAAEPPIASRIGLAVRGTPTLDGQVDDVWQSAPAMKTDRSVVDISDPDVASPAIATFRCLWDDEKLYVLAVVHDPRVAGTGDAPWDRDSIEVFLDELGDGGTQFGQDDGQYRIGADGDISYGSVGRSGNARAVVRLIDNGYLVEAAIAVPDGVLRRGAKPGFEVQVNDNRGGGRRAAVMKWSSPSDRSWRDPSSFGRLWLASADQVEELLKQIAARETAAVNPTTPGQADQSSGAKRPAADERGDGRLGTDERCPDWAADAIFYQIFPERFANGDPSNDPMRESLEFPDIVPDNWRVTPWTQQWYGRDDWERRMGDDFYENGVFHRRYGGDLQGVLDRLDYLQDLGINAIYFNPVFYARSLHKYDGNSFHHADPYFGPDPQGDFALMKTETADPATWKWTAADRLFLRLVDEAHQRGIRVIIDGVFNHTGRDFFAFQDIVKNGPDSPYLDWYVVHQFDDPSTEENEFKYQCWWGVDTLPEFRDNADGTDLQSGPRQYIFNSTRRWMDPDGDGDPSDGIDGWRLDVANEIPNQFWRDWNRMVRDLNPDAYTVAEFWEDAGDYLADCGFSATMNYHGFAYPVKGFLVDGRMPAGDFARDVKARLASHPPRIGRSLQNLIDSHDTDRVASMIVNAEKGWPYIRPERFDYDVGERVSPRWFRQYDVSRPAPRHRRIQRLVALFQMTFVGAPMIYYGTEAGMDGADDPDDRMPMVWPELKYEPRSLGPFGEVPTQPIEFEQDLFAFYRAAIHFRRQHPVLSRGAFRVVASDDEGQWLVFAREDEGQTLLVVLNRGPDTSLAIDPDQSGLGNIESMTCIFTSTGEDVVARQQENGEWVIPVPGQYGVVFQVN